MEKMWLMPDYYQNFVCKCGACRNICCSGWEVDVSMKDYFRLIGMECCAELHRKIECAFSDPEEKSEAHFKKIAPNWYGECPLLNENKLCSLQLEAGPFALPEVCRVYPRSIRSVNGIYTACCSASCEAVAQLLMRPEKLTFQTVRTSLEPEVTCTAPEDLERMRRACLSHLQDRTGALKDRVTAVCRLTDRAFAAPDRQRMIGDLPVYAGESSCFRPFADEAYERYHGHAERFAADRRQLSHLYPDWDRWVENLLANHLLYADYPYPDERITEEKAAHGLYAAWELLDTVGTSCAAAGGSRDDLTDAVAAAFHLIEHTYFYYNAWVLAAG